MREIEEDPELRSNFNLYKGGQGLPKPAKVAAPDAMETDTVMEESEEDDDDAPQVPLEELLEEMTLRGTDDEEDVLDEEQVQQ